MGEAQDGMATSPTGKSIFTRRNIIIFSIIGISIIALIGVGVFIWNTDTKEVKESAAKTDGKKKRDAEKTRLENEEKKKKADEEKKRLEDEENKHKEKKTAEKIEKKNEQENDSKF